MKRLSILVAVVVAVAMLGGCYLDTTNTPSATQSITLDLVSQAAVGYDGPGYYMRARIYEADVATAMVEDGTIKFLAPVALLISYIPDELKVSLNTQAFFVGANAPPTGVAVLAALPPGNYRVLLEVVEYMGEEGVMGPYEAGLTDTFQVTAGRNTAVDIEMWGLPPT